MLYLYQGMDFLTKCVFYMFYILLLIIKILSKNKSYTYPEDVASAEEPYLGDHGDAWAGYRVNRTAVESEDYNRLLGIRDLFHYGLCILNFTLVWVSLKLWFHLI